MVSIADCRCESWGSNLHFRMTPRCFLVKYSVGPLIIYKGLWLSGLSCLLLLHNYLPRMYGCRFESCQWHCSVYTNNKLSHPSSLSCVLLVAPTMVRSAVQPKTTRLCSSIGQWRSIWAKLKFKTLTPKLRMHFFILYLYILR